MSDGDDGGEYQCPHADAEHPAHDTTKVKLNEFIHAVLHSMPEIDESFNDDPLIREQFLLNYGITFLSEMRD